jgi:hypothetical protein
VAQVPTGHITGWTTRPETDDPLVAHYTSGWEGWVRFAGWMMLLLGIFNVIDGFVALTSDEVYLASEKELLVWDFTTWGWSLLVVGVIQVAAGIGVFGGRVWARTIGVILAGLSAVGHLAFVTAQPFWSVLIITMDVLVIYALIVHGREMTYRPGESPG